MARTRTNGSTRKSCGVPFSTPVVESQYFISANGEGERVLLTQETGAHLGEIISAGERSVKALLAEILESPLQGEALQRQYVSRLLNGGWSVVEEDASRRHSGNAVKLETLALIGGRLVILTFSLECQTGGHDGSDQTLTLYVTARVQNEHGEWDTHHLTERATNAQTMARACGCEMTIEGVLGNCLEMSVEDIIGEIRNLRARCSEAGDLNELFEVVRTEEQHRADVLKARNIWTGEFIRRDKVIVAGAPLTL